MYAYGMTRIFWLPSAEFWAKVSQNPKPNVSAQICVNIREKYTVNMDFLTFLSSTLGIHTHRNPSRTPLRNLWSIWVNMRENTRMQGLMAKKRSFD